VTGRPPSEGPVPDAPPPPGVEIRPARTRDRKSALRLLQEVAAEGRFIRTESVDRDRWRWERRGVRTSWTLDRATIVATVNGRVIGELGIFRDGAPVGRHVAALGMMVARDWRGRGVGSALLAEGFRWASWAGVEKVTLTVYPDNEPAIRLYRKFGFVEEGRLSGQSKKSYGYEDEIFMARWL
jgi:RimJ/RimL family protein N-acetyltransferase